MIDSPALRIFRHHFERLWKERHMSAYARHSLRDNIRGQRAAKAAAKGRR